MIISGKLSNYLKYAIGEVVLVVIGILIAIQLNQIDKESKLSTERVEHLHSLVQDLQKDVSRLEMLMYEDVITDTNVINLERAILNSEIALKLTYQDMTPSLADSILSLNINAGSPLINTETSIYDQLKSTGKLYSISSDELKEMILTYYTRAKREHLYNQRTSDQIQVLRDQCYFLDNVSADKKIQRRSFTASNYAWLFEKEGRNMNLYRAFLFRSWKCQSDNLYKMEILKQMALELIDEVESELNQNNG